MSLTSRQDRSVTLATSVFRTVSLQRKCAIPEAIQALIPNEDLTSIQNERHTPDSFPEAAGLLLDKRIHLVSAIVSALQARQLDDEQTSYCAMLVLKSDLVLLFCDLEKAASENVHMLVKALVWLMGSLNESLLEMAHEFFGSFYMRVSEIEDLSVILRLLPAVTEFVGRTSDIGRRYGALNLRMELRIFEYIQQPESLPEVDQESLARFSSAVANAYKAEPNFEKDDLARMILTTDFEKLSNPLLNSCLELLIAFHYHSGEILPLVKRVCRGFVDGFESNAGEQENGDARKKYANLYELPTSRSQYAIQCCDVLSEHFLQCRMASFNELICILIDSNDLNVFGMAILVVKSLEQMQKEIANYFNDKMLWPKVLSKAVFTPAINVFDTPNSPVLNLRVSVFETLSFLAIDSTVLNIRKSFVILLGQSSSCSKLICEILAMSSTYCPQIFTVEHCNDNLFDLVLDIALAEKDQERTESIADEMITVIFQILESKLAVRAMTESIDACERLFSLLLYPKYNKQAAKALSDMFDEVVDGYDDMFADAVHLLFQLIYERTDGKDILEQVLSIIHTKDRQLVAKRDIVMQIVEAIFRAAKVDNTTMIAKSLAIIAQAEKYPAFPASTVPFAEIGKVCQKYGQFLDGYLKAMVVSDGQIICPEALVMLFYASSANTESYQRMVNLMLELCKESICNRAACSYADICSYIFQSCPDEIYDQAVCLFKLVSFTVCNRRTYEAFVDSMLAKPGRIVTGIQCMLEIVSKMSSHEHLSVLQFCGDSAKIVVRSVILNQDHNSFVISSSLLIDRLSSGRNFFELQSKKCSLKLSFDAGFLVLTTETHRNKLKVDYPTGEWIHMVVFLKPLDGCITVFLNGKMRAGLTYDSHTFHPGEFTCSLFGRDYSTDHRLAVQVQTIEISNHSTQLDPLQDYDMLQLHQLSNSENCSCILRADYITDDGMLYADKNQQRIRFIGTALPFFTSFLRVLEATHAIDIVLALFSHVIYVEGLLETLLNLLKELLLRSKIVVSQVERAHGFAIIESYLQRLSQPNLSVQLWDQLIDIMKQLNGHLLDSLSHELLFNIALWSRAKLDVQHHVIKAWRDMFDKDMGRAKRCLQLPFLLSVFEKYSESPDVMNRLSISERSLSSRHLSFNVTPVKDHKDTVGPNLICGDERPTQAVQFLESTALAEDKPQKKVDIVHSVSQLSPFRSSSPLSRSVSTSRVNGRSVIATKLQKLRLMVLQICETVVSTSLNETDIACLFKAIRNAGNIDQTRELLELVDYILSLNKYPQFKLDNEWLSLFLHSHEEVSILMLNIMSRLDEPDKATIDAIQMLLILQSDRLLSTSDFSGSSVLCDACRLALGVHDPIILSEIISAPLIVRSPMYIHFGIVLSFAAPLEIKNLFFKFMCNVCSDQSNLRELARTSTILSMFLLIYWAIEKCCDIPEDSAHKPTHDTVFGGLPSFRPEMFDYNELSSFIRSHRRCSLPLAFKSVNDDAVKIIASICSYNSELFKHALDILDSISLMTSVNLGQLRSRLLLLMVENMEEQYVQDREGILSVVSKALFFHHTGFTNPMIQNIYHESEYYTMPSPRRSTRIGPEIPDLITLVNAYSGDTGESAGDLKFSLEIDQTGQWKDKAIAKRLILLIFGLEKSDLTYSVPTSVLLYFLLRFSDPDETGILTSFAEQINDNCPKCSCLMQKAMESLTPHTEFSPRPWESSVPLAVNPVKARKRRSQSDAMFLPSPTAALAMLRKEVAKKLSLSDSDDSEGNSTSDASSGYHGPTSYQSQSFRLFKNFAEKKFEKHNPPSVEIHTFLVKKMKEMINLIPKGRGMFIRLVQKRNGPYYRHHLESQLRRDGDKYYKRSSVTITRLGVPVVLKRNLGFKREIQNVKAFNSLQKTDFFHENVADSNIPDIHLMAQRLKVNRTINGTFSLDDKRIRFLTIEGKSLEIEVRDINVLFKQVMLQKKSAVELFTKYYHGYLFNFANEKDAHVVFSFLIDRVKPQETLAKITEKWVHRKMTNFEYLLRLNYLSGRTFNSILSYPVFPWVICDYDSESLDLDKPETYRDLSKPIGALNAKRLAKLKELMANSIDEQSFLYQSLYSYPFLVCHYLVRLEPFASLHIALQDGRFDCPARLFSSVKEAYERVTGTAANFKELIPEFFFCPDFLVNKNHFVFGGDVNDVVLPPWAEKPSDFIYWNRRALESDYVSSHLNEWIDLIWGYKQTGEAAEQADNLYDPRLYPDVWKNSRSAQDKNQIESLLAHVGQIPQQLFTTAHPKRLAKQVTQRFPVKLQLATSPIVAVNDRLSAFCSDGKIVCERDHEISRDSLTQFLSTTVMSDGQIAIIFRNSTDVAKTDGKTLQRVKRIEHIDAITCLCPLLDGVVTGGRDGIIASEHGSATYGSTPIVCVSANDKLGLVADLDEDRKITLLLASNFAYVRSFDLQIPERAEPKKILFCDGYGYICVLSTFEKKSIISMYTLNGELIRGSGIESEIVVIEAVSSPSTALDYLIFGDRKRRVAVSVAYEIEAATVLAETDSAITTILYDSSNERVVVGTQSGQVLQLSLSL